MKREEAVNVLEEIFDIHDEIHESSDGDDGYKEMTALRMAIEALQDEAEPGEWIERVASGDFGSHWYEYECSVCGNVQARLTNYCPNCGAKMTKGGEDTTGESL